MLLVATARIKDRPVFQHRGLMIDTARNFIPIRDLERTIDGMAASKLNVFHWHATDSQSFPLHLPSVPLLSRYGAYSPDHIYYPSDIRHIIEYALVRGVRVIIEIDAPSHVIFHLFISHPIKCTTLDVMSINEHLMRSQIIIMLV